MGLLTIMPTGTLMTFYSEYIDINKELFPLLLISLFWEGFPQDFGAFLWEVLSIHPVEHL